MLVPLLLTASPAAKPLAHENGIAGSYAHVAALQDLAPECEKSSIGLSEWGLSAACLGGSLLHSLSGVSMAGTHKFRIKDRWRLPSLLSPWALCKVCNLLALCT